MKRHLLFKSLLLLCALIVGSSNGWADTSTVTASKITSSSASWTGSQHETWSVSVNGGATNQNVTNGYAQVGTSSSPSTSITFSTSGISGTITSIVVNCAAYQGKASISATVGGSAFGTQNQSIPSWSSSTGGDKTFSGSASGAIVITMTNGSGGRAMYIKSITVTYSAEEVVAAPTFSPVAGEVTKGSTVTLTQAAADQIRYTLDGTDPTKSTGSVYSSPIVINEATVIKAIAIKGDKVSDVATAAYSVAYPKVLTLDLTDAGWGFPSDYKTDAATYTNNGYTITLDESSNGHKKVISSGTTVSLIFGKNGATLTLPAFGFNVSKFKVYGQSGASKDVTFNVYVGDDAVSTEAKSSKEEHEFVIAADKQAVGTIYTIKVTNSNNCQISKIEVFGNGCEAGLVQSYGWATYIPTANVEYPANTAYIVTAASVSSGLTLEEVTEVPTGTPILLKGAGAKTATVIASASDPATNLLEVSDGSGLASGYYPYVLAKNGEGGACFKQWTGAMSALNGRVMLVLDENIAAARGIFELDDDATGIKQVETSKQNAEGFYNLAGQRVANPTKGLYIVNGKKVIIK